MITKLKLKNFRRFKSAELDLQHNLVIIHGHNAHGKSTILEALHFITNSSSPFTSDNTHLFHEAENDFRIEIEQETETDKNSYAIYQDKLKRQYLKDNHKTNRKKFADSLASTIFSPEQIELLMVSPQKRRDFLNELMCRINPLFADDLLKMRKVLRHRNAYLKKLAKRFYDTGEMNLQDKMLEYWTKLFVETSVTITIARAQFIQQLRNGTVYLQYVPSVPLGEFLEMVEKEEVMKLHTLESDKSLRKDVATGQTNIGAHRDDWEIYSEKNIKKFGSRGEKRMSIGRLIFKSQEILAEKLGFYPTLLLDDISSELDPINTEKILTDELLSKQQVIITAISLDHIPETVREQAKLIEL